MKQTYHEDDGKQIIVYSEDISAALEQAKAERNAKLDCERFPKNRVFHRAAILPPSVIVEFYRRGINYLNPDERDQKKILESLNGEFADFKTINARL